MAVSLGVLLFLVIPILLGVVFLGAAGYALYVGFGKETGAEPWLGSQTTAKVIGVVALILGLILLCSPIVIFFFAFGVSF